MITNDEVRARAGQQKLDVIMRHRRHVHGRITYPTSGNDMDAEWTDKRGRPVVTVVVPW